MAYLAVKTKGNNRMPLKRESPEDAYGWNVSQDLRDMAKAMLLEPQYPVMNNPSLEYRIHSARPSAYLTADFEKGNLSTDGRRVTNCLRVQKGCLNRADKFPKRKRGIAYRARAPWQRSLRSSLRTGKPSTWRREAGVQDAKTQRYA
jgi:hypothetical protein